MQLAVPEVSGWERRTLEPALLPAFVPPGWKAAAQGIWGREAPELGAPTLTVTPNSHPGTCGPSPDSPCFVCA